MKKIPITRWLTLFVLFAFLFDACSTTMQVPTPTKTSPTQTYAPTETVTPEPTATSTPKATATPTQSKETTTSVPAAESNGLKPKDIFLGDKNHWLEILGDIDSVTRGSIYGSMTVDYQGRKTTYLVTCVIFHNSQSTSLSETSGNIPADEFKPGTRADWKDNQFDPLVLNDGSLAAWVKQQYGNPGDSVVIGLEPYADQIPNFASYMKSWETSNRLDFISNNFFNGIAKNGPDPAVDNYFQAHPEIAQKVVDFSTTANISDLDGAVFELIVGIP